MRSTVHITIAALLFGSACSGQDPRSGTEERAPASDLTVIGADAARTGHVAALLGNGKLLVAGGVVGGRPTSSAQLLDPATGRFTATGDLGTARAHATATVLQDGRVLIVGGEDVDGNLLASAELYDPARRRFFPAGSLVTARARHTATRLSSGHVLVAGGDDGAAVLASVEEYTPATGGAGTWSDALAPLGTARTRHTATLLGDGQLLFAGGEDAPGTLVPGTPLAAELYDPASGGSTSATAGAMAPRSRHVAVLLSTGDVLLAGGRDGSGETGTSQVYHAGSDSFTAGPGPVTPRADAMAALLPDGRVVLAGGHAGTDLDDVDVYDAAAASVSSSPDRLAQARAGGVATLLASGRICLTGGGWGSAELLEPPVSDDFTSFLPAGYIPRFGHTATLLPDGPQRGKLLLVGGIVPYDGYVRHWQLYDPATGTLTARQYLANARAYHTATVLRSGSVLVTGGNAGASSRNDAELFDGTAWTVVPATMNAARSNHTATLLASGKVLLTGGSQDDVPLASAEVFDPVYGTFTPTANSLSEPRVHHTAALLRNGKVLVVGGAGSATADVYDPELNTFTPVGELAGGVRARFTATPLADGRVLIAGGTNGSAALGTAELFDGASSFSILPGTIEARQDHAATVLPSGEVLIAGGEAGGGYLAGAELFDPSSGTFLPAAARDLPTGLVRERARHTLTLLPSGRSLAWGGENADPVLTPTVPELYDAFTPRAPNPPDLAGEMPLGSTVPSGTIALTAAAGAYFTGGERGGDTRSADVNAPVFVLVRQDGDGIAYARTVAFTATTARVQLPEPLPAGWWWIRAIVGGVPGAAVSVYVLDPFSITPNAPTVAPRDTRMFTATGGAGAPYTFALVEAGSAHTEQNPVIDPSTGVYVAGARPNSVDTISVTDQLGNTVTMDITIGDGVTVSPLPPWAVAPLGSIQFVATGGSGVFTGCPGGDCWVFVNKRSGGSIDQAGLYAAGATGGVTDELQVYDSLGNHAEMSVEVTEPLVIDPTTISVTPLGTYTFTATGGYETGGYTWSVPVSPSGGTIDASGNYRAGTTGSVTDVVRVTDGLGSWAEATVTVGPAVSIAPAPPPQVPPRGSQAFTASGGTDTFTGCDGGSCWSILTNRSGGSIDADGLYTAGPTPNVTDVIQVSDDLGNLATLAVRVGPGVSVTPPDAGAYPGDTVVLTAHGGSGSGYQFTTLSLTSGAGAGIVDHGDGTATYTAGDIRGATDLFRVTDSLGNTVDVDVVVWPDWRPGGSGCSAAGSSGGALALAFMALWLLRGGRRRAPARAAARAHRRGAVALALLLSAGAARAQTPPVSAAFVLDRFQPMGGAYDLLGVQSAQVPGHLQRTFRLTVNYATRPLVLTAEDMDPVALVKSQLAGDLSASLGYRDWAELAIVLPYMIAQSREQDRFLPPDLRRDLAGSGLGDVRIVPKLRLLEWRKLRLGVSAPVGVPVGNEDAFLGHGALTFAPTALVELDALGPARLLLNGGAAFRPERRLVDLTVGNAYTFGAGVEVPFQRGGQRFAALATFQGEAGMEGGAAARPMELLAGLRWITPRGLQLSMGGGPGIGKGYGTPQYRVFAELGFSTAGLERLAEKAPPPRPEPEPEPEPQPEPAQPEPPKAEEPKPAEPPAAEPPAAEPEEPKPGEPVPLPEPRLQEDGTLRIDARVYFEFNKKEIKPEYRKVLKHVAQRILSEPRMQVIRIEGHADDLGPPDYNLWLSEERARAVKDFLERCGVPSSRFAVIGFGKTKPTAPGRTRDDRAKNRRVEFSVQEY